ncbi:hypothetical protein NKI36_30835, partial [Mesorhizobium caraganae]
FNSNHFPDSTPSYRYLLSDCRVQDTVVFGLAACELSCKPLMSNRNLFLWLFFAQLARLLNLLVTRRQRLPTDIHVVDHIAIDGTKEGKQHVIRSMPDRILCGYR